MMRVLIQFVTGVLLLSNTAFAQFEDLSSKNVLSVESRNHDPNWVLRRLNLALQAALTSRSFPQKEELQRNLKARIGEFFLTPEGQYFLNSIAASSYIRFHRRILRLLSDDEPRKRQVIEAMMMESWPNSPTVNLDTGRKFIYLSGIYSMSPNELWLTDPEMMLAKFGELHPVLGSPTLKTLAYMFFFQITKNTVVGAIHLSPVEEVGLVGLLKVVGLKGVKPHDKTFLEFCELFLLKPGH